MKFIHIIVISIIVALIGLGSIFYINKGDEATGSTVNAQDNGLVEQDIAQQNIVKNIMARLQQQGVPIKSIEIARDDRWNPPIAVTYVLQSSSTGDKVDLGVPAYSMLAGRAVNLAQRYGLVVGAVGQTVLDAQGKVISSSLSAVIEKESMTSQFDSPQLLGDNSVATLIRHNLPLYGMSLDKIEFSLDIDGMRWATIELSVPNIETANAGLSDFIRNTETTIEELNSKQETQIAVYEIKLSTIHGEPLLTYVYDSQLGAIWWQAEGLTMDWFPHPNAPM